MGVSSKPSTPATRTSRAGKWNGAAHSWRRAWRVISRNSTRPTCRTVRGAGSEDGPSEGETGQAGKRDAASGGDGEADAGITRSADLTDPDSRSMATSGRGSGVVGYNVQVAVDTEHHLIITHEVTNDGSD